MALKHNKLLIGLFIFVALLMLSGFAILNIYAADGYSKYARENEASLLKSMKLNYLNLAADIDNALYRLSMIHKLQVVWLKTYPRYSLRGSVRLRWRVA
jgi:hypothetical protein